MSQRKCVTTDNRQNQEYHTVIVIWILRTKKNCSAENAWTSTVIDEQHTESKNTSPLPYLPEKKTSSRCLLKTLNTRMQQSLHKPVALFFAATVLTRPYQVETAPHGCNYWLYVCTLSCCCPRAPLHVFTSLASLAWEFLTTSPLLDAHFA